MQDFMPDLSLILTIILSLILIKKEFDDYIVRKIDEYWQKNRPSEAGKHDDGRCSKCKHNLEW
jgi:hypothetical protein